MSRNGRINFIQDWIVKLMELDEMAKLTGWIKALSRLVSIWKLLLEFFVSLFETERKENLTLSFDC